MRKFFLASLALPIIFGTTSCNLSTTERGINSYNVPVERINYGRFLDYIEAGRVINVKFLDGGRSAVVETVDSELDNSNSVQLIRVDLPGIAPELLTKLKEYGISFDVQLSNSNRREVNDNNKSRK